MKIDLSKKQLYEVKYHFNNILRGLRQSDFIAFIDNIKMLVDFCEKTTPISFIVNNYENIASKQFDEWYKTWYSSGAPGKKHYIPIPPDESGNALIYEFLKRIISGEIYLRMFCQDTMNISQVGTKSEYLKFYDLFIDRFADDINRKLDDYISDHQIKEKSDKKKSNKQWSRSEIIASIMVAIIVVLTFILNICNNK